MAADVAVHRFEALRAGLPATSPGAWRVAAMAMASRASALASRASALAAEGERIGHRHGFDSGPFMAHVYRNRAQGRTALGRRLDRRLLDRPTCQAFRDVRGLAETAVLGAIDACEPSGGDGPVIADLACWPSPYLLRALWARPAARAVLCDTDQDGPAARAVLCDTDQDALDQVASLARDLGVGERVRTVRQSAFDPEALASLVPRPDVVCELGLYGIYHDGALIERHLADLGSIVRPRQVVCNVQVDNPEIEYIARVWRNAKGERCVWRLRPAEQIEAWARAAGYEAASVSADRHHVYRVMRFARREGLPA